MKNIYQSCDLAAPLDVVTSTSANNVICLLTFAGRWSRIAMTLSAGVPPPGCYKTYVRYDLIENIMKTRPVRCLIIIDI